MHRPTSPRNAGRRLSSLLVCACLLGLFAAPAGLLDLIRPTAHAETTFVVNSTGDAPDSNTADGLCNDGAGNCTLRAAIQQAQATSGADTINLNVTGTINLTAELPEIASHLVIKGPGSALLTVRRDTGGDYRIFNVAPAVIADISGLTLANGKTRGGPSAPGVQFGIGGGVGGGLSSFGTLTLTDVKVTGNSTGSGGSGTDTGGSGGDGGGIYNGGSLTMTDCVVSGNSTGTGGSGSISKGTGGHGGGVYNRGTLTMTNTVVGGNSCGAAGAGTAGGSGGGVYHQEGALTLNGVTVGDNKAGDGAADGTGGDGGGIFIKGGAVTLTNGSVSGNAAGLSAKGHGVAGGILNRGSLAITGSTVSGNTTGSFGGGILNRGTLKMANSTVSGNQAENTGAIRHELDLPATLTNCTVTANHATSALGGVTSFWPMTLANTVIARNTSTSHNIDTYGLFKSQGHNFIGAITPPGGISQPWPTAAGDRVGTHDAPLDPKLGPLADNGGTTRTHAPLAGSPLLDAGDNAIAKDANGAELTTDQRGARRFAGPGVNPTTEIGAFEFSQFMNDLPDVTTNEDTPAAFPFFVGDQAVTSLTMSSSDQTLVPDANISVTGAGTVRTVRITPAPDLSGTAVITVNLSGSLEGDVSQTFNLTVRPVNDAPSFTKGADPVVAEDAGPQTYANWVADINLGPNEPEQTYLLAVISNTNPALFSAAPALSQSGTLTFTPAPNAFGTATLFVELADNGGSANGGQFSNVKPFKITITPVNDPPVAHGSSLTVNEDSQTLVTFSGSDPDLDNLTFALVSGPTHGTLTGTGTSRTYKPDVNYNGTDSVVYKAVDTSGAESAPATVSLTVVSVNDAPVNTVPPSQTTNQNTPLTFSAATSNAVSIADVDAGGAPMLVTLTASGGTLTLGRTAGLTFVTGDGVDDATVSFAAPLPAVNAALDGLVFKPGPGVTGSASFSISANDQGATGLGGPRTDSDIVSVTVRPGGSLRVGAGTAAAVEAAGTVTVNVLRQNGSAGAASVNFATADGTATGAAACGAGADYVTASGTLSWADGDSAAKSVVVTLCNDQLSEPDETLTLTLADAAGSGSLGTPSRTTVTVKDDDAPGGIIELSQSSYTAAEGSGALAVTVRRGGDTTRAASVDYATDDGSIAAVSVPCSATTGLALDRCDFTKTQGTLAFAAGEAEKTFNVLLGDDSYVEGPETALVVLSNPGGGAVLGARAAATLQITDDAREASANPVDDSGTFVRQHYADFLGREPDAPGLAFWTNEIESCGADAGCREVKRIHVSAAFFLSIEFQETGFLVYRLNKAAFGNLADKPVPASMPEFLSDTQVIGRGVVVGPDGWAQRLEDNKRAFADAFAARARFKAAFPAGLAPEQFVDRLNVNAAGVLTQAERDALVAALRDGAKTRAEVLRAVAEHPSLARREFNQAFVLMQFFGYLRRDPDSAPDRDYAGYAFWLSKLNEFNGHYINAEMVRAFISSAEYRKRFGQQ